MKKNIRNIVLAKRFLRQRMKFLAFLCAFFTIFTVYSQSVPQDISYTRIYDFVDELAIDGVIDISSVVKPYTREFIAQKLLEASRKKSLLTKRQRDDLDFFLNDYALECDTLPKSHLKLVQNQNWNVAFVQPAVNYKDDSFKFRVSPLLGINILSNDNGIIVKRWFGADMQMTIVNHISVYGSLRDNSFNGNYLNNLPANAARLSKPSYLNNLPGCEYKEAEYGGDFSDVKGGIKLFANWGSIGLIKDNIIWGDNYHGSNIISGRAPSFPMISLNLKPVSWFELNYIHGWLVSNVIDSTYYYVENYNNGTEKKYYRPANKFIAANMLTFTPIKKLNISLGNSIIYSERNVQAAYFIPIAFYKSIDHLLTKGLGVENQNSQMFANISSRNIKHLHLYGSLFIDEFSLERLKPDNPENNPISYKIGMNFSNFPFKNISFIGEFTRSNIITYKHSIETLTWASNGYNLGHYLGDNSQEIYVALNYKPVRSLNINLSYTNAIHGNEYEYIRKQIEETIAQVPLKDITWRNEIIGLEALYEIWNNAYATFSVEYNNARGYDITSPTISSEVRKDAQGYLDMYTPAFYQGENITFAIGLGFGF